jgi:Ca2+-binding RTX toxin-like protein
MRMGQRELRPRSEIEQLNVWDVANGVAPINLTGNEFNNNLNGDDGDNILNGDGADVMNGWKGNDGYIVDDPGDSLFENYGEGFDTVLTSVTFDVGPYSEIEVLQGIGTADINPAGSIDTAPLPQPAGALAGTLAQAPISGRQSGTF